MARSNPLTSCKWWQAQELQEAKAIAKYKFTNVGHRRKRAIHGFERPGAHQKMRGVRGALPVITRHEPGFETQEFFGRAIELQALLFRLSF